MIRVRDLRGNVVGYLEANALRDDSGKAAGSRVTTDRDEARLGRQAVALMSDRPVLMDLGPSDVTTPATQFTVGLPKGDFVADRVAPVRLVSRDRGVFFAENATDAITLVDPVANALGEPAQTMPGIVSTTFTTTGYALAAKVPRQLKGNADFDIEAMAIRRAARGLRLAREVRVANLLTTSTNWNAANRITAAAKWNGGTGPNPLGDMMNALKASILPSTVMVLPEYDAQFFYVQPQASTGIRDYVQAGGEMPERLYARAKMLLGGATTYVWAQASTVNIALVRVAEDPDEIATASTCRWAGTSPDGDFSEGLLVRRFHVPREDSDYIVVAHNDAEVMLSNQVGALIVGAIQ